ncbi:MAG TPA: outer membrane protein assembly factor BamD, partial [Thermoanaerobaculia bacterium]|nr:outer membrane protein assembly factor BamD [Thermoanaerobaculia bacterium]
ELTRLYPTSEYAAQAREQMKAVTANLAEHEFAIGRFYQRYGLPVAAAERFEFMLKNYPQYPEPDKVIYHLGVAYRDSQKGEEAKKTFDRLRTEFPQSPYLAELQSGT